MGDTRFSTNLAICCFGSFINIVAMTVFMPFLPAYVESLGDYSPDQVYVASAACYAVTFLTAAVLAPVWGRLADRYGSKPNLIRASCGMFVCMSLIALADSVWQLFLLRALVGAAGGYTSGAAILVAQQSRTHSGFTQGLLASSVLLGSLAGPAIGGFLAVGIGMRGVIAITSALILVNVIATLGLTSDRPEAVPGHARSCTRPSPALDGRYAGLLVAAAAVMIVSVSIEPIIYAYVSTLQGGQTPFAAAGLALSAMALGSVVSSSIAGRLADRIGYERVLAAAFGLSAVWLVAHVFVDRSSTLVVLRCLLGLSIGGALPCIRARLKQISDPAGIGRVIGWSTSAQYVGQVAGPLGAGLIAAAVGIPAVFLASAAVSALVALGFVTRGLHDSA
ncbi:MFS transporter [Salinisphaera sp. Q1T1-3]|uniref:MFS transporter n=1 Tax=Salinisphaera sp. Q1T1-3 TaxID=2321229 RepID=UPI000E728F8E|nr:MFS transporter [Salinisphaera sp. Q1T1-3]RJS93772.1 MFS transporter [Salinisphaera sp. Q1T1-3]